MLTPEELDLIPDSLDGLFQELDDFIIRDYARRVAKTGRVTDTAEWMSIRSEEIGLSEEEIQKEVARILELSQEEITEIFPDTVFTAADSLASKFTSAGLSTERILGSAFLERYIKAAIKQTNGELSNITRTLGVASAEDEDLTDYYTRTLDFAQLQVSTGMTDYNTAVRNAVKDLAAKGVQYIDYESGRRINIASAARMCTLTGVTQMAKQITDITCDELDTDLIETSAHPGARPTHAVWQGKIFSRSGKSKKYPPIEETGLGTAGGLCGVNCRHLYFPYFDGAKRMYPDDVLANIDPPPFTYEGKEYTYYDAAQKMRYMERQIRKTKRQAVGFEAAGLEDDFTAASIKLNRQRQEYKKFAKAAGMRPRYERAQELGYNRSVSGKAVARRKSIAKMANSMYDTGSEDSNIRAYMRDKPLRDRIQSDAINKSIERGQFLKHVKGSHEYEQYKAAYDRKKERGPSYLTISEQEAQELINRYAGTGILRRGRNGQWLNEEIITVHPDEIGMAVNNLTGTEAPTTVFKIKYSPSGKGTHIIPDYPSKKGAKGR